MNRVFTAALLLLVFTAANLPPAVSAAQGAIDLGQEDYSTWSLYGSATLNTTTYNSLIYQNIVLTSPGVADSAGAAFAPAPLTIDLNQPFSFRFPFYISPGTVVRGDGLTFVLAGTPRVGNGGSGLGYETLNGVAFAVDTFDFGSPDPVSPSLQILTGGSVDPVAFTETGLGDDIWYTFANEHFQWNAIVSYTPSGNNDQLGTLTGSIQQPAFPGYDGLPISVSAPVDLSLLGTDVFDPDTNAYLYSSLYYGFTAGNGLADDGHFVTSVIPIPEPASLALLAAGSLSLLRRRRAA
ncbi:MAG: PEP-CTERM sorting domain-containing protein [Phycisphaeraceae bacterium]